MFFLTPRYLKQARLLHKGVTRFVNYKRDLLPQAKLNEITALRTELESAMKGRDEKRIDEVSSKITKTCQGALPDGGYSEFADNVEVFFVAIVVALGIRAYIAQPFKIPTGSMQPTLNGYIATPKDQDPTPNFFLNWYDYLLGGRTYINAVSNHEGYLRQTDPVTEHNFLLFFPYSTVHFEDGHSINISSPFRQLMDAGGLGFPQHTGALADEIPGSLTPDGKKHTRLVSNGPVMIRKGQTLARGILDGGDHVLVNKFLYNFRSPKRGEVFVFTTNNISSPYMQVPPEQGAQHYIKRLVGVPGDELEVKLPPVAAGALMAQAPPPGELWVNGRPADEFGIKRVASAKDGYRGYGAQYRLAEGNTVKLAGDEYWAMGDNSYNSSDSRYWGTVPQRNLVGPGMFCYLPFGRHWGPIK